MTLRRQLAVASPLSAGAILGAARDSITSVPRHDAVSATLQVRYDARSAVLTGSGTAALVLALRALVPPGESVAMPAYACVDLIAAARRAGAMIRLYDVEPTTLSPDLDSLRDVVDEGVAAIVVVHLYGFLADMRAVNELARHAGVPVIEDAAQGAGGVLGGVRAGAMGDLVVLSFGRGKGITSGRGGALLARTNELGEVMQNVASHLTAHGSLGDAVVSAASWLLGRPSLYAIPSAIPGLHLGETVYHDAGEPDKMSSFGAALLSRSLQIADADTAMRRRNAFVLRSAADTSRHVQPVRPIDDSDPGYLRFPILTRGDVEPHPRLGVTRAYPRPLADEPEIASVLRPPRGALKGSIDLARRLVTLPTHRMVADSDIARLTRWMQGAETR